MTRTSYALTPSDPVAWKRDGDYFCGDHGTVANGDPIDGTTRVVLRGELTTDDWYVCEECGRPCLWADGVAAVADIIQAAEAAGFAAAETSTGGGCMAVELIPNGSTSVELLITDGDAGLPDGGEFLIGIYRDGEADDDVTSLPHDMPRLVEHLRSLTF